MVDLANRRIKLIQESVREFVTNGSTPKVRELNFRAMELSRKIKEN